MFMGEFQKVSDNKNALRTQTVMGIFPKLPEVGERFTFYARPIETGMDLRIVRTSVVQSIEGGNFGGDMPWRRFVTENSVYMLFGTGTDVEKDPTYPAEAFAELIAAVEEKGGGEWVN